MCAMPLAPMSILSKVVGLVLAAMLLKVCGCDRYEDDDLEGDGDGGLLGGRGRTDASSSASRTLAGDHVESRVTDDGLYETSSSSSGVRSLSSLPSKETVLRLVPTESVRDCVLIPLLVWEGRGDEAILFGVRDPRALGRILSGFFAVPPSLRWSQLIISLFERRITFFWSGTWVEGGRATDLGKVLALFESLGAERSWPELMRERSILFMTTAGAMVADRAKEQKVQGFM